MRVKSPDPSLTYCSLLLGLSTTGVCLKVIRNLCAASPQSNCLSETCPDSPFWCHSNLEVVPPELCLCGLSEIPNESYLKKMHRAQCFASGCCCVVPGEPLKSSLMFTEVVFSLKAVCLGHTRCATLPCCSGLMLETSMYK